jgi:predicted nucleic acid-binding Zn ribbon protein
MPNILLLSIETAKRDLMSKPLLYCIICGKPRVKGDYKSRWCCSEECYNKYGWNYCLICGKKLNEQSFSNVKCSRECYNKKLIELLRKFNELT